MADTPLPDKNPYLMRAMHQWMSDCGLTPHIIVDASRPGVQVPVAHVKDGRIVLNISLSATQHLDLGNDTLEFNTRFGGRVYHVIVPVGAVLGIYARETNEGMVFTDHEHPAETEQAGLRAVDTDADDAGTAPTAAADAAGVVDIANDAQDAGEPPEPDSPPPAPTRSPGAGGAPARQRPTLRIVK